MAEKTYSITKTRRGIETVTTDTLPGLIKHFGYTLESGHSYDRKVNLEPKTARSLVSNLNRAVSSLQRGSYDPNYYELTPA